MCQTCDAAYVPSYFCDRIITRRFEKIDVIESPFVKNDMELDNDVYRTQLEGKEYLLFISILFLLKGIHLGIEATDYVLSTYSKLNLVYVGRDGGIRRLKGNCQNIEGILRRKSDKYNGKVMYLGKNEHKKLYPIMSNSLACGLPSRGGGTICRIYVIEAMSCGKIVTDTYGASFGQLIKNKYNGLLIQKDSANALIKAVKYLMELSEQEREQIRVRARVAAMRLRSVKIYKQVIAYDQQVISNYERKGHMLK